MNLMLSIVILGTMVPIEKIVVVVNDRPIMHSQVIEYLAELGIACMGDMEADILSPQYSEALEEIIDKQLLVQAALNLGLYPEVSEILPYVEEEMLTYSWQVLDGTDAQRREYLMDAMGDEIAAQTFMGSRIQAALRDMPLSPETFLISNSELVNEAVMPRHVGWIYLPVLPGGDDLDAAMEQINEIRTRIVQGESFEGMASLYSDDGSSVNGGSLGTFGPTDMTAAFERAVFALVEGELSLPVLTPFGVHLIRLDSMNDDGTVEASHILISVPIDQMDIDSRVAEANLLRESIVAGNGFTFADAAMAFSQDLSNAGEGGDMGTIPLNLWLPTVALAADTMEAGDVSHPIVLPEAGAVVLITLYDDPGEVDWSEYSEMELNGIIQQVIYQDTYNEVLDSLRREIPVIYYLGTDRNLAD